MSHIKRGVSIVVPDSLSVDAASAAGVQHFVYISVTGTHPLLGHLPGNPACRGGVRETEQDDLHHPVAKLPHGSVAWPRRRL